MFLVCCNPGASIPSQLHLFQRRDSQHAQGVIQGAGHAREQKQPGTGQLGILGDYPAFVVKTVKLTRQFLEVIGDPMRLKAGGAPLHHLREGGQGLDDVAVEEIADGTANPFSAAFSKMLQIRAWAY